MPSAFCEHRRESGFSNTRVTWIVLSIWPEGSSQVRLVMCSRLMSLAFSLSIDCNEVRFGEWCLLGCYAVWLL
jgi:hypothetical protein